MHPFDSTVARPLLLFVGASCSPRLQRGGREDRRPLVARRKLGPGQLAERKQIHLTNRGGLEVDLAHSSL